MATFGVPAELIGAVLNQRFRLLDVLGEGGLGVVFRGRDLVEGHELALKMLRPEFCSDPDVVERFLNEGQTSCLVQHPGIVRVFGTYRAEDETPYVTMELLSGHSLAEPMSRGHLPEQDSIVMMLELLDALAAAHNRGIIHRDLKPDNVFVATQSDQSKKIKLLDFGISRVVDAAGGAARKTKTGMLLGTAGYMSPEQVRNAKLVDHRSDLWAVGVLIYEMLTATLPYEAENDFALITAVLFGPPRPMVETAPHLAHWQAFFDRALALDPGERFQSAGEMAEALDGMRRRLRGQNRRGPGGTQYISQRAEPAPSQAPKSAVNASVPASAFSAEPGLAESVAPPAARVPQVPGAAVSTMDDVPASAFRTQAALGYASSGAGGSAHPPSAHPGAVYSSSMPPSAWSAAPPRAVGGPTAVSAAHTGQALERAYAPVVVRPPQSQTLRVPWWVALLIAVLSFVLGLGLGWWFA